MPSWQQPLKRRGVEAWIAGGRAACPWRRDCVTVDRPGNEARQTLPELKARLGTVILGKDEVIERVL